MLCALSDKRKDGKIFQRKEKKKRNYNLEITRSCWNKQSCSVLLHKSDTVQSHFLWTGWFTLNVMETLTIVAIFIHSFATPWVQAPSLLYIAI